MHLAKSGAGIAGLASSQFSRKRWTCNLFFDDPGIDPQHIFNKTQFPTEIPGIILDIILQFLVCRINDETPRNVPEVFL